MAEQFLNTLPEAQNLPTDSTCMICLEYYGDKPSKDGTAEHAVLLPCGHHVGAGCISVWLSKNGGNTCPKCRAKFFAATSRPYMEHGFMNEDEDDIVLRLTPRDVDEYPDLYEATGTLRDIARIAEQAGRPFEEQDRRASSAVRRLQMRNEVDGQRQSYEHFLHRSTEEYLESLRRARNIESAPAPPPPGFLPFSEEEWARQQLEIGATPTEIADERLYRADSLESRVESLARSFRLLSLRETMLYIRLQNDGAEIPRLVIPLRGLNEEQEEALFLEIERRGAFDIVHHVYYGYPEGTNRERWRLHRERHGQVWNPVERHWL